MNQNKKEDIAVTALTNEVNKYDNIEENFNKRDKEPVWDGDLYLYKKGTSKKSDIVGRIPVQIKGTNAKSKNDSETYYDVEIVDIENYRKDNKGAIYFVVEIKEDRSTKIYYKIFDLKTVEEILNDNKLNRKTKRFKFKELENNCLISICIEFIRKLRIYKNIKPINEIEVYDKKTLCYDNNTKYELENMKEANKVFYETNAYKEAKEKLEKQNIIILHGEPWVGKTSTARKLVTNYIEQGYMFIYGNVDDLVEIKNKVACDKKIICLIDDFLGSNIQYLEKNIAESTLDKIVSIFKSSKNKKLILTTRTYIYNNAKKLFYKFHKATSIKDEYLIDVANYDYKEKGNILYNHMEKNNLLGTDTHVQLVNDNFYIRVISHKNFNPGVIALICERLKGKEITDIQEFIKKALDMPEELWEDEYQKLNTYEKIILTIIVVFGVKVPEKYIKEQFEQILKDENIKLLDTEIFSKSVHVLSNAFIKITFNDVQERQLEVCKHSVADFIINKIRNNEIKVDRYIKSAKYSEVLHYINRIFLNTNKLDEIEEKLAIQVENKIDDIDGFFYNPTSIVFDILNRRINKEREKKLKDIIEKAFYFHKAYLILNILEDPVDLKDTIYLYTKEKFKEYIIEKYNFEFLYQIRYASECEIFFKTCLEVLDYKKNSDYMIKKVNIVIDALIEVVTEDVEATIEDVMMESVAKEIIEGKKLKDIINEHIEAVVNDEIPSLKALYSKQYYKKILQTLYKFCYVTIDKDELEETIEKLKQTKPKEEGAEEKEIIIYGQYNKVDKEQVKYIKEKFEKGITKTTNGVGRKSYYDLIDIELRLQARDKWWLGSFIDDNDYSEYRNLELYKEFIDTKQNIDNSLKGLAKQFLEYLLHEKNNISEKAQEILTEIAYTSFFKGQFIIDKKDVKTYEKKFSSQMKELYNAEVIIQSIDGYKIVNKYIHLYLAISELTKKQDNLLAVILEWCKEVKNETDEEENISQYEQEIFQLYSELNTIEFNKRYLIPALKIFTNEIKERYKNIGKLNISKAIINLIELEIELTKEFKAVGIMRKEYIPLSFIEFVTGTDLQWDMGNFDYSIYQEEFYDNCYNEEEEVYVLNFNKILKDKKLKDICDKIKIWDYLYDVYMECDKCLEILKKDDSLNLYNVAKEKIVEKYFG